MTELQPPPVGPAIGVESTRRNLRRYLRVAGVFATLAAAFIVLGAALWVAHARSFDIQADGHRADGTVEKVTNHQIGNPKISTTILTVAYTANGTRLTERISLGGYVAGFHPGQTVTVLYDPSNASYAEIQGHRSHAGVPSLLPAVLGLLVLSLSWPGIRRARYLHRVLTNDPWDAHRTELVEVPYGGPMVGLSGRVRLLLRIHGMTGTIVAAPVGLRRLNPTFTPVAWVAAFGDRQMVVAPPGGSPILCVRAVSKLR